MTIISSYSNPEKLNISLKENLVDISWEDKDGICYVETDLPYDEFVYIFQQYIDHAEYCPETGFESNNFALYYDVDQDSLYQLKIRTQTVKIYESTIKTILENIKTDIVENKCDVSFMWHMSCGENEIIDYNSLTPFQGNVQQEQIIKALNSAFAFGFRTALRKLEDMGVITLGDIDRRITHEDRILWNFYFNDEEE